MVTTASAPTTASCAEAARAAPRASARRRASSLRSKATTSCPALARFAAIPPPILPSPMNATRAMLLPFPLRLTLPDEGAHPFLLILAAEQAVEEAAFEQDALGDAGLEGSVDHPA